MGVILSGEKTRLEVLFENKTNDFDFSAIYGTISIEINNGSGQYEHRQISSVFESESDNPLIPQEGESLLSLEQVATNIAKLTCLIDPEKLEESAKYKITARIGCYSEKPEVLSTGIYESLYSEKYE